MRYHIPNWIFQVCHYTLISDWQSSLFCLAGDLRYHHTSQRQYQLVLTSNLELLNLNLERETKPWLWIREASVKLSQLLFFTVNWHNLNTTGVCNNLDHFITSASEVLLSWPFVCLFLSLPVSLFGIRITQIDFWLDLPQKRQKMGFGPT